MRKLIALAVVCLTGLVFAAVAYAVNVYTVTPASTKGGGGAAGTAAKPQAKAVKFGFKTKDSGGGRATPIKKYSIGFQGLKYFGNKSAFPKCKFSKINTKLESDVRKACGKGVGGGLIDNNVGQTGNPATLTTCRLRLKLYNTGKGLALRLDGGNTAKPPTKCPIAINQAIDAKFKNTKIGGISSPALVFSVPSNLLHPGSPNISNAIATTTSTISGKARKVKIKGKTQRVSILSSVKCKGSKRTIQVSFTDEKGSTVPAKAKIKC